MSLQKDLSAQGTYASYPACPVSMRCTAAHNSAPAIPSKQLGPAEIALFRHNKNGEQPGVPVIMGCRQYIFHPRMGIMHTPST